MRKPMVISLVLCLCLGLAVSSAQVTTIDGTQVPLNFDASGDYQFIWTDTLFVNYERATTAADSAKVDSCRLLKNLSIFQFNADNVTIDGNGKVIYSAAAGKDPDIQPVWLNRIYKDTTHMENFYVHDFTVMNANIAVYLTKVAYSLVENVTVKEANRGIYYASRAAAGASDGLGGELAVADTVRNCTLENVISEAIPVRGTGHQILSNTISATHSLGSSSTGIAVQRSATEKTTGVLVDGNVINGNGFLVRGIRCDASGSNTYENNTINKVTGYGVGLNGHASRGLADNNTFLTTAINLSSLVDSALGISLDLACNNLFDGLTIDSAGVAIKAFNNSVENVISNATITNSKGYDVHVLGNSNVFFTDPTDINTDKVLVEAGSAIFFGEGFTVDLAVTTDWDIPTAGQDVTIWNGQGHHVGTVTLGASGTASFMLAEEGVSMGTATYVGNQNPYTFVVETGDLYASYAHEFTDSLKAAAAVTIDMDIMWQAPPSILVTSEEYTYDVANDTLMLNYLWAENAADSAAVDVLINACRATKSVVELNADHLSFDGNGQVIYGPNSAEDTDQFDVQGIWPNRIYEDTTEFTNITISDATVLFTNNAIYLTEVRNGLVEGCTVAEAARGIYPNAKYNKDATGNIIRDNTLINVDKEAIAVRGPGVKILDNTITATRALTGAGTAISIQRTATEFTTDVLVQGNSIVGNSFLNTGIQCNRSGGNEYRENVIMNVAEQGFLFDSHATHGMAEGNSVVNTMMMFLTADSVIGFLFNNAHNNTVDTVAIINPAVAFKSVGGSQGNVIDGAVITGTETYDAEVAGNSSIFFIDETEVDAAKVFVEAGSALYFGAPNEVEIEVLLEGSLPLAGLEVMVTAANDDTVGTFITGEDGLVSFPLGTAGITSSGAAANMNPFTFTATHDLGDGNSAILGSVIDTVTADKDITLNVSYLGIDAAALGIPEDFALSQNYPNPFNPSTTIRYALPVAAGVKLQVYDITGRVIRTLVNSRVHAGYHNVVWDGKDNAGRSVASGLYIYELAAGDFRQVKKMMFLK